MTALTMKSSNPLRQGVSSGLEHRINEPDGFSSRAAAPQRGFVSHAQPSKDFSRFPNHSSTATENEELSIAENMMNMSSSLSSQESASSSPKTFPHILRTILNSNLHSDVMTWILDDTNKNLTNEIRHERTKVYYWRILDLKKLEGILPRYFNHGKYNSFLRQVYRWGFKRYGKHRDSYYHELFQKDNPSLSEKMTCAKQNCSHGELLATAVSHPLYSPPLNDRHLRQTVVQGTKRRAEIAGLDAAGALNSSHNAQFYNRVSQLHRSALTDPGSYSNSVSSFDTSRTLNRCFYENHGAHNNNGYSNHYLPFSDGRYQRRSSVHEQVLRSSFDALAQDLQPITNQMKTNQNSSFGETVLPRYKMPYSIDGGNSQYNQYQQRNRNPWNALQVDPSVDYNPIEVELPGMMPRRRSSISSGATPFFMEKGAVSKCNSGHPQRNRSQKKIAERSPGVGEFMKGSNEQIVSKTRVLVKKSNPNDVLIARGREASDFEGNIQFQSIVASFHGEFSKLSPYSRERSVVAKRIVKIIMEKNPPGRFLKEDSASGLWYDAGVEEGIKMAMITLRSLSRSAKRSRRKELSKNDSVRSVAHDLLSFAGSSKNFETAL